MSGVSLAGGQPWQSLKPDATGTASFGLAGDRASRKWHPAGTDDGDFTDTTP